ncbi:MAG: 5'-methylthioadenosine phosphorylase [Gammaproteobacteria bacterium]|nr:MAG: 5'-methylthioadenosine phosphorylase [Gammaproteobacteria bacterium]
MIGIIGGSSLQSLKHFHIERKEVIRTPFGIPSAPLIVGVLYGQPLVFLARHGLCHTIPPHLINYRANIWALHHMGCREILAFSAMCSISPAIHLGQLVVPDQLIDYTWNRGATFFDSQQDDVNYTEFSDPYTYATRQKLIAAAKRLPIRLTHRATYGITQGPRYETRAEVQRYQNDGCHLLGMTGMPEAALAQEAQLDYAVCGLITNGHVGGQRLSQAENSDCQPDPIFSQLLEAIFQPE